MSEIDSVGIIQSVGVNGVGKMMSSLHHLPPPSDRWNFKYTSVEIYQRNVNLAEKDFIVAKKKHLVNDK